MSLLALPDCLILPHTPLYIGWDFPLCLWLSFISPHYPCFVSIGATMWTDELKQRTDLTGKCLKKGQVSDWSFAWSESLHFRPKLCGNARSGQLQRDRTSIASIGAISWAYGTIFSTCFSSFRDFGKVLKEGLIGPKTRHWSIHIHPHSQTGLQFLRFLPYYHGNLLITIEACLRHQFQCSKALESCINLNVHIYGVLWVKKVF